MTKCYLLMQNNTFSRLIGRSILWVRFDPHKGSSFRPSALQTQSVANTFVVIMNTKGAGVRKIAGEFVRSIELETR